MLHACCTQVACARKECEAAAEGQQQQQQRAPEAAPPSSSGAGPSSSVSARQGQLQRMYVSQLPEGTCLYPGSPLARESSTGAGGSAHGGCRGGGAQSSSDWVDIALHPELHAGPSGSREARGGMQALQVEERRERRRWWPGGGVAYMGSGVYLWGAPRDTTYRERVHGARSAAPWA